MRNKMDLKVKVPLIITAINFATHLVPFVIMMPLLLLNSIFNNELEIECLGIIFIVLLLISVVIYLIGVFLSPLIQFVLVVVAMVNKKWWLVGVHIVSVIMLSGGIVLFIKIFEQLTYAT